jgi:hypothetical protein
LPEARFRETAMAGVQKPIQNRKAIEEAIDRVDKNAEKTPDR